METVVPGKLKQHFNVSATEFFYFHGHFYFKDSFILIWGEWFACMYISEPHVFRAHGSHQILWNRSYREL